jgi:hypothetical protein
MKHRQYADATPSHAQDARDTDAADPCTQLPCVPAFPG